MAQGGVGGRSPPKVEDRGGRELSRKFQPLSLSFTGQKHRFSAATGTVLLSTHYT